MCPLHFLFSYHNIKRFPLMKIKFKTIVYHGNLSVYAIKISPQNHNINIVTNWVCHEFSFGNLITFSCAEEMIFTVTYTRNHPSSEF